MRRCRIQRVGEPHLFCPSALQPFRRQAEESLPSGVRQAQPSILIEGEDRHVDLGDDAPQQRRRLECSEPLLAQGVAERVHLQHRQP